ncbi:MAG: endonuclease/exonuclease/phosphatase family protein [Thiohalocapsa sp.]|nr:endonuclease/exonuclease/phosphatase family protein [Thiohalocapsa sp.]
MLRPITVPAAVAAALALALSNPAAAESVTFMTWNINGGQADAAALADRARMTMESVGPVDVVLLQEVIAEAQVAAVAEAMGLAHYAISDFSPPPEISGAWFKSLEVAVLSRLPIEGAAEWDTTGREPFGDTFAPRLSTEGVEPELLVLDVAFGENRPSRGFLRVDLEGGWSVYSVHWKSSRGDSCNAADIANARQREDQAAGLVLDAARVLQAGRNVVVAGDYNIQAPGRVLRVGTDAGEDCAPTGSCEGVCGPGGSDGYDDSIHRLMTVDPGARLLSAALDETFVARSFPGGAIDHILVAGPMAEAFEGARTPSFSGELYFGSDHRPVLATVMLGGEEEAGPQERIRRLIGEIRDRLSEIEGMLGE